MVPSTADITIQDCRISQSETSAITIGDVINIHPLHLSLIRGDQNEVCYAIVRLPIHLAIIPTNEPCRAFGCDLIALSWFYYPVEKLSELPCRPTSAT